MFTVVMHFGLTIPELPAHVNISGRQLTAIAYRIAGGQEESG